MKPIMTIDNLDDFEEENLEMAIDKTIENNCLVIFSPKSKSHGTGFLIDADGTFLSAGHVFKNTSVEHCVYYKGNKYDYETILIEYTDNDAYLCDSKLCKDLFVGRLLDFHDDAFDSSFCLGDSSALNIGTFLFAAGYKRVRANYMESLQVIDGVLMYCHEQPFLLCSPENIFARDENRKLDVRLGMKNVKALDIPCVGIWHGLSGGPVFHDKEIYGVLIADMFITAEYIKSNLLDRCKTSS